MPFVTIAAVLAFATSGEMGGGPIKARTGECITPQERTAIEETVAQFHKEHGTTARARAKYQLFPMGAVLGQDAFPTNYVDLDSTTGLRDWDCTNYTYDGHRGIDVDIRGFAEQDAGVPIFAPLDGTVVEVDHGNFDRNVAADQQPGNHVILYHGGTHYSLYWHLKRGTATVKVGDQVKAGQQIGMVASSGSSTGPHLHFESWSDLGSQFAYEPHTGPCNPGESGFVNQIPVPRSFYVRELNMSMCDFTPFPLYPWEPPRAGTFAIGSRPVGFTAILQNLPAQSTWRVRYVRPNGTAARDTGNVAFNNAELYRGSIWWWRLTTSLNVTGLWTAELWINGAIAITAPFRVTTTYPLNDNRPPHAVGLAFVNPSEPGAPLSVRITSPAVVDDPDFDVVSYRYVWKQGTKIIRDAVSAGHLDMIPGNSFNPNRDVSVTVTPTDGINSGPSTTIHTRLRLGG